MAPFLITALEVIPYPTSSTIKIPHPFGIYPTKSSCSITWKEFLKLLISMISSCVGFKYWRLIF